MASKKMSTVEVFEEVVSTALADAAGISTPDPVETKKVRAPRRRVTAEAKAEAEAAKAEAEAAEAKAKAEAEDEAEFQLLVLAEANAKAEAEAAEAAEAAKAEAEAAEAKAEAEAAEAKAEAEAKADAVARASASAAKAETSAKAAEGYGPAAADAARAARAAANVAEAQAGLAAEAESAEAAKACAAKAFSASQDAEAARRRAQSAAAKLTTPVVANGPVVKAQSRPAPVNGGFAGLEVLKAEAVIPAVVWGLEAIPMPTTVRADGLTASVLDAVNRMAEGRLLPLLQIPADGMAAAEAKGRASEVASLLRELSRADGKVLVTTIITVGERVHPVVVGEIGWIRVTGSVVELKGRVTAANGKLALKGTIQGFAGVLQFDRLAVDAVELEADPAFTFAEPTVMMVPVAPAAQRPAAPAAPFPPAPKAAEGPSMPIVNRNGQGPADRALKGRQVIGYGR